jgi:hypothetical protein
MKLNNPKSAPIKMQQEGDKIFTPQILSMHVETANLIKHPAKPRLNFRSQHEVHNSILIHLRLEK